MTSPPPPFRSQGICMPQPDLNMLAGSLSEMASSACRFENFAARSRVLSAMESTRACTYYWPMATPGRRWKRYNCQVKPIPSNESLECARLHTLESVSSIPLPAAEIPYKNAALQPHFALRSDSHNVNDEARANHPEH